MASSLFTDVVCALIVRDIYKRYNHREKRTSSEIDYSTKRNYFTEPALDSDEEPIVDNRIKMVLGTGTKKRTIYISP